MTQPTSSQLQAAPQEQLQAVPQEHEFEWVVEMPKEIAEMFGVRAELPVTLHARPDEICAHMDLTEQTAEARGREPGWFIPITLEIAATTGFAAGWLCTITPTCTKSQRSAQKP